MSGARSVRCSECGVTLAVPPFAPTVCCFRCRRTTYVGQNPVHPPANFANPGYQNQFMSPGMQQFAHPNSGFPAGYPNVFGKKRALLIGINDHDLEGPVNDAHRVASLLTKKFGFPRECILILTDKHREPNKIPTRANMITAMHWLVSGCTAGDSLVFFYAGHGMKELDESDEESDGEDEALCPVDYLTEGSIRDDEVNEIIVQPLPYNVKLHAIFDTCVNGTGLDLPYQCHIYRNGSWQWKPQSQSGQYKGTSGGLAVLISACEDHQLSQETHNTWDIGSNSTGVMTNSFIRALESDSAITYGRLLTTMKAEIRRTNAKLFADFRPQDAQLSSSEMFDIYRRPFLL